MGILFNNEFEAKVEQATSELLPEANEDMQLNLEICDLIKGKHVAARDAMRSIKHRLENRNPNVQLLSLKLVDTCVKNCGMHFLQEIAGREFVDSLLLLIDTTTVPLQVRVKALEFIQLLAVNFQENHSFEYVCYTYVALRSRGFNFSPPPPISKAIFDTQTAPEWKDAAECTKCRGTFSVTVRKHHCRNCGNVFCSSCSGKEIPIPSFGFNEPVRVCDYCESLIRAPKKEHLADDDLQMAIKLSLQESQKPTSQLQDTQFSAIRPEDASLRVERLFQKEGPLSSEELDALARDVYQMRELQGKLQEKLSILQQTELQNSVSMERIKIACKAYEELLDWRINVSKSGGIARPDALPAYSQPFQSQEWHPQPFVSGWSYQAAAQQNAPRGADSMILQPHYVAHQRAYLQPSIPSVYPQYQQTAAPPQYFHQVHEQPSEKPPVEKEVSLIDL